jgi:hypothetical protein
MLIEVLGEFSNYPREVLVEAVNNFLRTRRDDFLRGLSEYDISKEAMLLIAEGMKSAFEREILNTQKA